MTTTTESSTTTQVYRVYIKATPEAIWEAITSPEWTRRYGYGGCADYDLRPGGAYRATSDEEMRKQAAEAGFPLPEVMVDGEVVEADPPRRLVQTWRLVMDPGTAEEGFTRLTWEIEPSQPGVTRVTVIHDLTGAPKTAALVAGESEGAGAGGGWAEVLSDLKSLLETGKSLRG